jgi:hypothetical protein
MNCNVHFEDIKHTTFGALRMTFIICVSDRDGLFRLMRRVGELRSLMKTGARRRVPSFPFVKFDFKFIR